MRHFSPIVGILSRVVGHGRHDTPVRCRVAPQLVCHQLPQSAFLPLQELAKEPFGRVGISMLLNEHVAHISILVDSPPEIVALTLYVHEESIQVPDVSLATIPTSGVPSVPDSELLTPLPDRLVGEDDSALCQEVLNIAEAQAESVIQPDRVTDDQWRKPLSVETIRSAVHHQTLAGNSSTWQYRPSLSRSITGTAPVAACHSEFCRSFPHQQPALHNPDSDHPARGSQSLGSRGGGSKHGRSPDTQYLELPPLVYCRYRYDAIPPPCQSHVPAEELRWELAANRTSAKQDRIG